jgi:hypothetical protein
LASFSGNSLDASVLLMIEVGFIDPKETRVSSPPWTRWKHCVTAMRRYEAPTISASQKP